MHGTNVLNKFDKSYLKNINISKIRNPKQQQPKPNSSTPERKLPVNREHLSILRKAEKNHNYLAQHNFQPILSPTNPHFTSPEQVHAHLHEYRKLALETFRYRDEIKVRSKEAFLNGNRALAYELSGEAQSLYTKASQYNALAAERIFYHYNPSLTSTTVDLHGLYIKEAIYYFGQHLQRCINRGEKRMEIVVGMGKQSASDGHKVGPAIIELCKQLDVFVCLSQNRGLLLVRVDASFDSSLGKLAGVAWESEIW